MSKIKTINNIEINKVYDYFDDGKIKYSRKIPVKITEIIPFDKADSEIIELWKEDAFSCEWLYAKETDYFIKGDLYISDDKVEEIIFVRTKDGGWFSLDFWAGSLDFDGSLIKILEENNLWN
jgi:hypothetical protein